MWDVSKKPFTLRTAIAEAVLTASPATIEMARFGRLPKGDPVPVAKVAALQAVKNTPLLIPHCHPLPIESAEAEIRLLDDRIVITVTVKAIYRTGVEMEALTGAATAALTLYDMMKAVDKGMIIGPVRLLEKMGGKSAGHGIDAAAAAVRAHVVVVSDSVAGGKRTDSSGRAIMDRLIGFGMTDVGFHTVSDDADELEVLLRNLAAQAVDLVITTGGTGPGPRDNVPEVMDSVLERELPGVAEALRAHGQERTPLAMLSRGKAGLLGRAVIVNLPGSVRAVEESLDALFPTLLHAVDMVRGGGHDEPA